MKRVGRRSVPFRASGDRGAPATAVHRNSAVSADGRPLGMYRRGACAAWLRSARSRPTRGAETKAASERFASEKGPEGREASENGRTHARDHAGTMGDLSTTSRGSWSRSRRVGSNRRRTRRLPPPRRRTPWKVIGRGGPHGPRDQDRDEPLERAGDPYPASRSRLTPDTRPREERMMHDPVVVAYHTGARLERRGRVLVSTRSRAFRRGRRCGSRTADETVE